MGQAAEDLEAQQLSESLPYHEFNPRGYKTAEMFTWKTKDGTVLKLSEMGDRHIANCIKLLNRHLATKPPEQVYWGDSEYAEEAVESENRINDNIAEELTHAINVMTTELNHRGYTGTRLKAMIN